MKSLNKIFMVIGIVVAMFASTASANINGISYNHVEVGYNQLNLESDTSSDLKLDGPSVNLSFLIAENIFIHSSYAKTSDSGNLVEFPIDFGNVTGVYVIDYFVSEIGLGYRQAVSSGLDFVATVGYVNAELEFDIGFNRPARIERFSDNNSGYSLAIGLRFALTPEVEMGGNITHVKLTDFSADTGASAYLSYFISNNWSAKASVSVADNTNGYGLSIGYHF